MYGFTGDPRTWIPAVDSNIKFCYGFVQPYEAPKTFTESKGAVAELKRLNP